MGYDSLAESTASLMGRSHALSFSPAPYPRASLVKAAAVASTEAALVQSVDEDALVLAGTDAAHGRPRRGQDGRLLPMLTLPGDTLQTTWSMVAVTASSTLLTVAAIVRAFVASQSFLTPLLGVCLGAVAGELFSGVFHWATDNYGRLETPVVGFACAAFQGHHLAPWTISHRSVWNNVHKIAAATHPLILMALALLPPAGAAFTAVMLYSQVMAQEFHRWSHTTPSMLAPWQRWLQRAGIALPFREHCAHHKPPFDKHYCILTGGLNRLLDSAPLLVWRRLEAFFYRQYGVEPLSWKDARVKQLALGL